jgi:hypothetical protein
MAASMHCLWRTIVISREADAARRGGALIAAGSGGLNVEGDAIIVDSAGKLPPCLVSAHIHDLAVKARLQGRAGRPDAAAAGSRAGCAVPTSLAPSPATR